MCFFIFLFFFPKAWCRSVAEDGAIMAHCSLNLWAFLPPQLRDSSTSASRVAGTTGVRDFLKIFHKDGDSPSCPGLEHLLSSDAPALASQSTGITGLNYRTGLTCLSLILKSYEKKNDPFHSHRDKKLEAQK